MKTRYQIFKQNHLRCNSQKTNITASKISKNETAEATKPSNINRKYNILSTGPSLTLKEEVDLVIAQPDLSSYAQHPKP